MFGRLTEGIEKGSKQGYTLRQSDVAMGTSTPFVDVLSEHGGFSLLLFDCSQKFNWAAQNCCPNNPWDPGCILTMDQPGWVFISYMQHYLQLHVHG